MTAKAWLLGAALAVSGGFSGAAQAQEARLLQEMTEFTGMIGFLGSGAPGFVLAAVSGDQTAVAGFGEIAQGSGKEPDGGTLMRIGSISKAFCGIVLSDMAAKGELALTDRLADRTGLGVPIPSLGGRDIRLIDLVTQASGLPREVPQAPMPPDDPFGGNTPEAQKAGLAGDPLLFAPGTGALYSNWGFDLLGEALAHTGGKPYADLLRERVFAPAGMTASRFDLPPEAQANALQGHFFDGSPMPFAPTPETIECAGGLYATADDMTAWMRWLLSDAADGSQETRAIDRAAWLWRDGLSPVSGLDDGGGDMDAMGAAWVIRLPEGNLPLTINKTGGLQGVFSYVILAPGRGAGVFAAMNEFNVAGFSAMVAAAEGLLKDIAPR